MQKQMSSKKIIIMIVAAVFVIAAAAVILLSKKDESFRSILVYDLEGNAVIERVDIGTIDAAENLYLESGDRVSVKEESMMRMKLDDDKYITAEENTVFSLEAKGNEQDSKTKINLEQGSITNEIQNPLSGESVYETATPNSVMAVRGTIYRAELSDDGEGGQDMRICCFQGTVATTPILPDGTMGEEILVHAGSEMTVDSEGITEGPQDIDFDTLPEQALLTLSDIVSSGTEVTGISKEELDGLLSSSDKNDVSVDTQDNKPSESEIAKDTSEVSKADQTEANDDKQSENEVRSDNNKKNNNNNKSDSSDKDGSKGKKDGSDEVDKEDKQPQNTTPSAGDKSDKSGNDTSDNGSQDGNSDNGSGDSQDSKPDKDSGSKPNKPSKTVTYTVTYKYQGSVFATQSVKKGDKAMAPTLAPAAEGTWDFNFDTKITADTTIEWK